jgi:hypothetical protein
VNSDSIAIVTENSALAKRPGTRKERPHLIGHPPDHGGAAKDENASVGRLRGVVERRAQDGMIEPGYVIGATRLRLREVK